MVSIDTIFLPSGSFSFYVANRPSLLGVGIPNLTLSISISPRKPPKWVSFLLVTSNTCKHYPHLSSADKIQAEPHRKMRHSTFHPWCSRWLERGWNMSHSPLIPTTLKVCVLFHYASPAHFWPQDTIKRDVVSSHHLFFPNFIAFSYSTGGLSVEMVQGRSGMLTIFNIVSVTCTKLASMAISHHHQLFLPMFQPFATQTRRVFPIGNS